jgi:hypothetical protein
MLYVQFRLIKPYIQFVSLRSSFAPEYACLPCTILGSRPKERSLSAMTSTQLLKHGAGLAPEQMRRILPYVVIDFS